MCHQPNTFAFLLCHQLAAVSLAVAAVFSPISALSPAGAETASSPATKQEINSTLPVRPIRSAKSNTFVSPDSFIERLAKARVVILGEVHDNPDHHQRRAKLIEAIVSRRAQLNAAAQKPGLVFEHFKRGQQALLTTTSDDIRRAAPPIDVDMFLTSMSWDKSGWPKAELFVTLFRTALTLDLPLYAGDADTDRIRSIAKTGMDVIPDDDRERLGLTLQMGKALDEAALEEIESAHCGLIPKEALAPMAAAQRFRDAMLADATLNAATQHGAAILLTGNVHARLDRGVPWYLRQRGLKDIVSVQFRQAEGEGTTDTSPENQRASPSGTNSVADYIIETPYRPSPDRCRKLRHHFRKKGG